MCLYGYTGKEVHLLCPLWGGTKDHGDPLQHRKPEVAYLPVPVLMQHSKTYIFHVDANNAFLSWSAVYQINVLGKQPDLRTIPSIVVGDQEKRHGIVLAKSIPAKKYGIQTGEAIVTVLQKCPSLVVVPPDYSLYVTANTAIRNAISKT